MAQIESDSPAGWRPRPERARCSTCTVLDREKSSAEWLVCPSMPVNVMAGAPSDECGNYIPDETAKMLALFDAPAPTPQVLTPDAVIGGYVKDSPEIREAVLEKLAAGIFLREIARMDGMPSTQAVRNWCKADPDFAKEVEAARLAGCDTIAESCLQIADDGSNDTYVDDDGNRRVDTDHIQRSKLRVWTRLELLKKMYPKKYGDKVDLNHGGQEGNPVRLIAANMTPEESTQLYTEMLKVGR